MQKPRLGHINFINCLPLTYGFKYGCFDEGIAVHPGVPAKLNSMILDGMLDVSPVSSVIYARNSAKFLVLPNVSISADGKLRSILLVAKRPIDCLDGARIALTAKSATSHCLLKIILHHAYQAQPEYFISDLSLDGGVLDQAEAVLFIGDDALFAYHNRRPDYYYYDIGAEWKKLTGLPMVYAVWIVNRQFAEAQPDSVQTVYDRVTGGFAYGLKHINEAVVTMVDHHLFNDEQVSGYLRLLNWEFTPAHEQALLKFYQMAFGLGLIERVPAIEFAEVKR